MVRVLHIVPNMNMGGLETFIMNVYRNINKEEIQFDFLEHYQEQSAYDEEIINLGGKIYHFSLRNDNNIFKYIITLNNFFKTHPEYKIIHCHMSSVNAIVFLIAKKNHLKIRIAHSHNTTTEKTIKGFIKRLLASLVKYTSTVNFACSTEAGIYLFKPKKFEVIPNAIDLEKFKYSKKVSQKLRKELNLEGKYIIGHIGRFSLQKNHDFLIDLFYEYQLKRPDAVLVLVGTGELLPKMQKKVQELKIQDKVIFLGVRKDVFALYSLFDLFLFPSLFEGLPLTLVEAQANSLTCLVSENISKEVIISNKIHFLDIKSSKEKWLQAIEKYSKESRDKVSFNNNKDKFDILKLTNYLEQKYKNYLK